MHSYLALKYFVQLLVTLYIMPPFLMALDTCVTLISLCTIGKSHMQFVKIVYTQDVQLLRPGPYITLHSSYEIVEIIAFFDSVFNYVIIYTVMQTAVESHFCLCRFKNFRELWNLSF